MKLSQLGNLVNVFFAVLAVWLLFELKYLVFTPFSAKWRKAHFDIIHYKALFLSQYVVVHCLDIVQFPRESYS